MGALSSLSVASSAPMTHPVGGASGLAAWLPPAVGGRQAPPPLIPLLPPSEVLSSPLPEEQQLRETAAEVQALLVRGKKGDAFKVRTGWMSACAPGEYCLSLNTGIIG